MKLPFFLRKGLEQYGKLVPAAPQFGLVRTYCLVDSGKLLVVLLRCQIGKEQAYLSAAVRWQGVGSKKDGTRLPSERFKNTSP